MENGVFDLNSVSQNLWGFGPIQIEPLYINTANRHLESIQTFEKHVEELTIFWHQKGKAGQEAKEHYGRFSGKETED